MLAQPSRSGPPRISQLLPTVKCSSCARPVPLDQLGDHICSPTSPSAKAMPGFSPTSPVAPSPTSLLPKRLQNIVRSKQQQPPPPQQQQRSPPTTNSASDRAAPRPQQPPPQQQPPARTGPGYRTGTPDTARQPPNQRSQPPAHVPPPLQTSPNLPFRTNTPSNNNGPIPRAPSAASDRAPARSGSPFDRRRLDPNQPARAGSPSPSVNGRDHPRVPSPNPSMASRNAREPPRQPSPKPSLNARSMREPIPPSPAPSSVFTPTTPFEPEPETRSGGEAGMAGVGRRGFAAAARAAMFAASSPQPNSPGFGHPTPPVGLGVGQVMGVPNGRGTDPRMMAGGPGMDGRRANKPYLDINTEAASASTPPLSPNSGSQSSSYSPGSPNSPHALHDRTTPTPKNSGSPPRVAGRRRQSPPPPFSPDSPLMPDPEPEPAPAQAASRLPFFERLKLAVAPAAAAAPPPPPPEKEPLPPPPISAASNASTFMSPTAYYGNRDDDEDSEYGESGLAYARSSADGSETMRSPEMSPLDAAPPKRGQPARHAPSGSSSSTGSSSLRGGVQFPSSSGSSSSRDRDRDMQPRSPGFARSISSASAYSSRTAGALDRASGMKGMESVPEGDEEPVMPRTVRSPENKAVKLPTRSMTSPTVNRDGSGAKRKKERICVSCDCTIADGRWIQTDGGGVLCERCWKNMYLPKCRRCSKTIEKAAVSSSDGQLKGKYHRECFNCHTCHKPFPDKTFYVLDGKPFCAYHYHEANDSLCAAAECGQPIEGPCAVSHAGDRYHPDHLTCEYELRGRAAGGGVRARRCGERLDGEYWEVDGTMLCERHARRVEDEEREGSGTAAGAGKAPGRDREREGEKERRAMKRTTRMIDLAALAAGLR